MKNNFALQGIKPDCLAAMILVNGFLIVVITINNADAVNTYAHLMFKGISTFMAEEEMGFRILINKQRVSFKMKPFA